MNINMNELIDVIVRALVSLITLFFVAKLIGKKQVSQLSLFDYVIGISIGNFAAEMTINLESDEIHGIVAVLIFGFVAYFVSILTMKSIKLRRFFMGTPTIVIENGKIIEDGLKKVRYDINDLLEECRINGYYDISNIEYAIVEANGEVSILPNNRSKSVTVGDLDIKSSKQGLCANVIIDGKIMYENLTEIGKSEEWLTKELIAKGKELNNIILGTIDVNDTLVLYERNKGMKVLNVLE